MPKLFQIWLRRRYSLATFLRPWEEAEAISSSGAEPCYPDDLETIPPHRQRNQDVMNPMPGREARARAPFPMLPAEAEGRA